MISLVRITAENQQQYLESILEIETLSYPTSWSAAGFIHEIRNPVSRLWAALTDGKPSGYICYWILESEASLLNLAVHPRERKNGIGTSLLNHMVEETCLSEVKEVWLEVRVSNAGAIRLYRRFGFEKVGLRSKYYENPQEDAIVMGLHLTERSCNTQARAQGGAI